MAHFSTAEVTISPRNSQNKSVDVNEITGKNLFSFRNYSGNKLNLNNVEKFTHKKMYSYVNH